MKKLNKVTNCKIGKKYKFKGNIFKCVPNTTFCDGCYFCKTGKKCPFVCRISDGFIFKKVKHVLKDENGVKMYKGDKYCWVDKSFELYTNSVVNWSRKSEKENPYPESVKMFATIDAANKWINENKK